MRSHTKSGGPTMLRTSSKPGHKISPKEAAMKLSASGFAVTARTIIGMCRRGELEGSKKIGGLWFIQPQSIETLID